MDFSYNSIQCVSGILCVFMMCLYASREYFVQIWDESQFKSQSYKQLLYSVSACSEHVTNSFAIFSEEAVKRTKR